MKRFNLSLLILLLITIFIGFTACALPEPTDDDIINITILHTNDTHGHPVEYSNSPIGNEGGIPARYTLIEQIRNTVGREKVLLLDAGDINTGRPESTFFYAEPDVIGMNEADYQAMTIGNHEFDNGIGKLKEQETQAEFPFLAANIYYTGPEEKRVFQPYVILEVPSGPSTTLPNGQIVPAPTIKIGVLGLSLKMSFSGIQFTDPIEEAKKVVPEIRKQADIVVALTHIGYDSDVKLASAVTGIDIIIGGHTHTKFENGPILYNNTWIHSDHEWGHTLGRLDLEVDIRTHKLVVKEGKTAVTGRCIPVNMKKTIAPLEDTAYTTAHPDATDKFFIDADTVTPLETTNGYKVYDRNYSDTTHTSTYSLRDANGNELDKSKYFILSGTDFTKVYVDFSGATPVASTNPVELDTSSYIYLQGNHTGTPPFGTGYVTSKNVEIFADAQGKATKNNDGGSIAAAPAEYLKANLSSVWAIRDVFPAGGSTYAYILSNSAGNYVATNGKVINYTTNGYIVDPTDGYWVDKDGNVSATPVMGPVAAPVVDATSLKVKTGFTGTPVKGTFAYSTSYDPTLAYPSEASPQVDANGTRYQFLEPYLLNAPKILTKLQPFVDQVNVILGETVGSNLYKFENTFLGQSKAVRLDDFPVTNFVTNAMLEECDADIVFQNAGGIRAAIPAGTVTKLNVYTILPFDNNMVTFDLTGAQVKLVLAHAAKIISVTHNASFTTNGAFLQVAGMTWKKVNANTILPDGTNIVGGLNQLGEAQDILVDGTPISDTAIYKIATINYLAQGGDGYTILKDLVEGTNPDYGQAQNFYDTSKFQRDVLIDWYLKQTGPVNPEDYIYNSCDLDDNPSTSANTDDPSNTPDATVDDVPDNTGVDAHIW